MPRATDNPMEAFGWAWKAPEAPRRLALPRPAIRLSVRRSLALAALGLGGLAGAAFLAGFLAFVALLERAERFPVDRADGIVALTGGSQRIEDAIALLAAGHGRRLLISGVNERTTREEIARLNPTQRHWIACCVDLDYRARNTIGNAIETRRWMRANRFETVAVVTSNYHMPRTLIEFGHALKDEDAIWAGERVLPHPVVSEGVDPDQWWRQPATARLLASEYVKFLAAWLRTRVENDPEHSRAAVLLGGRKPVNGLPGPLVANAAR
ncbi:MULTISPECIES: YdcF family protein [Methylobacterium]|uniref:DUF218 domain-containing protein n=1 Tax=Methylobacterium jeotgali TaxID=381630 RepID=A0ABQ4T3V6_9HYPH|nr:MULTISPECIES: YdcF family protein [Methylobacterium]PIU08430.1 MAG: YdcF family protein [Methylobacterium sp. CG09_land_8_20_14_0_10_71_15]PIU11719.1 MAG: YdcF family protein [Methylobacterium sp. CG08_land_8_20_14_0_20_71_15]GBU20074.1 hypothetical protein AwMethylo_42890 [Methylobacterium sp.]GJE08694.1 hypothetical protein AOPFMNJM_4037 [Methylobacterium jeotgali]